MGDVLARRFILDSSPIILLSQADLIHNVLDPDAEYIVPSAVAEEILIANPKDK